MSLLAIAGWIAGILFVLAGLVVVLTVVAAATPPDHHVEHIDESELNVVLDLQARGGMGPDTYPRTAVERAVRHGLVRRLTEDEHSRLLVLTASGTICRPETVGQEITLRTL